MKRLLLASIISAVLIAAGCEVQNVENTNKTPATPAASTNENANVASPQPQPNNNMSAPMFTLPMLLAFLDNQSFTADLKTRLQLTDEQIQKLQALAQESRKETSATDEEPQSSYEARQVADEKVKTVLGQEKTQQLASLINEYWNGKTATNGTAGSASASRKTSPEGALNAVPNDTRIVINSPAYRLDVFDNGQLIKSYKVGIGYPEFPLPEGMRQAKEIIFNPSWVPPDEPWVEASNKIKAGEKIEAGSRKNPLGIAKIPIGLPSLIHGGKNPKTIGGFASHGCVGLTDSQMRDFVMDLAKISDTKLTEQDIENYGKNRSETKNVKLTNPVPVELRYETIVVEDGKLHIYRDVYDMNTNTEENLQAVLSKYGVTLNDLSQSERDQVMNALREMSRDAKGRLDDNDSHKTSSSNPSSNQKDQKTSAMKGDKDKTSASGKNEKESKKQKAESAKVTRTVKGAKEMVIEIAALQGKGYPAPVALEDGSGKPSTPIAATRRRR